jgi:hypothetical protein
MTECYAVTPILRSDRFKEQVCNGFIRGTTELNTDKKNKISSLWSVVFRLVCALCDELVTRSEEFYLVVLCLCVCVCE